eukprot:jgi/Botrbrau1/14929/Bobra.0018s0033.1
MNTITLHVSGGSRLTQSPHRSRSVRDKIVKCIASQEVDKVERFRDTRRRHLLYAPIIAAAALGLWVESAQSAQNGLFSPNRSSELAKKNKERQEKLAERIAKLKEAK